MTILDAADVLDDLAAGRAPDSRRALTGALALNAWCQQNAADPEVLDAAAGLDVIATGGTLDLSDAGKARAALLAAAVRRVASE